MYDNICGREGEWEKVWVACLDFEKFGGMLVMSILLVVFVVVVMVVVLMLVVLLFSMEFCLVYFL